MTCVVKEDGLIHVKINLHDINRRHKQKPSSWVHSCLQAQPLWSTLYKGVRGIPLNPSMAPHCPWDMVQPTWDESKILLSPLDLPTGCLAPHIEYSSPLRCCLLRAAFPVPAWIRDPLELPNLLLIRFVRLEASLITSAHHETLLSSLSWTPGAPCGLAGLCGVWGVFSVGWRDPQLWRAHSRGSRNSWVSGWNCGLSLSLFLCYFCKLLLLSPLFRQKNKGSEKGTKLLPMLSLV